VEGHNNKIVPAFRAGRVPPLLNSFGRHWSWAYSPTVIAKTVLESQVQPLSLSV